MTKLNFFFSCFLVMLPLCANADDNPSIAMSDFGFLIQHYGLPAKDCNESKGAIPQSSCMQSELDAKETEMNRLLDKVIADYDSYGGSEANKENRERIQNSQSFWVTYRDDLCNFGYVTHEPMHSSSMAVSIISCKLLKTEERIDEIKKIYIAH